MTTAAITLTEWNLSKFHNIAVDQAKLDLINKSEILKADIRAYNVSTNTDDAIALSAPRLADSASYSTPGTKDGAYAKGILRLGTNRTSTPEGLFNMLAHELGHFKVEEPGALVARARLAATILNDKDSYTAACNMTEGQAKYNEVMARREVLSTIELQAFAEGRDLTPAEKNLRTQWATSDTSPEAFDRKVVLVFEDYASRPNNPPMTQEEAKNAATFALGENNKNSGNSITQELYLAYCRKEADRVLDSGRSPISFSPATETLETTVDEYGTVNSIVRTEQSDGQTFESVFDSSGTLLQETSAAVVNNQRTTTQIVYADDGLMIATIANDGLNVTFGEDVSGNWKVNYWTQEGQTYTGDDLGAFITSVQNSSDTTDANNSESATNSRIDQQFSSAAGNNAPGVSNAKDSGASLDTLGTRLGLPYISDRWAPSFLGAGIPSTLMLSSGMDAAVRQALGILSQSRVNTLREIRPSEFTVRVLGFGGALATPPSPSRTASSDLSLPLVLDLGDDGLDLMALDRSNTSFDVDANGNAKTVGWIGGKEGILVFDKNANGVVDDASEWFGQKFAASGTPPANQDGFKALATLANAGATSFSATTSKINPATGKRYFDELQVWIDADQDGKTDAGELRTLASLGITSIDLNPQAFNRNDDGNVILSTAGYTTADGKRHTINDVGLATELTAIKDEVRPVSAAALAFAEYAGKGYAAMAAGQAKAIAIRSRNLPANEQAAISALQQRFVLPTGPFSSPEAFEARAKGNWSLQMGLGPTGLNDKVAYFYGPPPGDRTNVNPVLRRINTAPGDIINALNGLASLRQGVVVAAGAIEWAGNKQAEAQRKAQVANATQKPGFLDEWAAREAAQAWDYSMVDYLNVKDQIEAMTARLPEIQNKLNELVPQNLNLSGHLSNGATFLTRGDAAMAAEAFRAYASALQPMAELKVLGDQMLGAIAQSNGYTRAYVGKDGQTTSVDNGYNLLIGNRGNQTFNLNSGVDNIAVTYVTGTITVNNFQTGANGDQVQVLDKDGRNYVIVTDDGRGNVTLHHDGRPKVTLQGVDASTLDLFANLVGIDAVRFQTSTGGVRSLRGERIYDGQIHVRSIIASDHGDTLIGGDRDTRLEGGRGTDTFIITGLNTTVVESTESNGKDVASYAEINAGIKLEWKTITYFYDDRYIEESFFVDSLGSRIEGVNNFVGSAFNDQLTGNYMANALAGGAGNDVLDGGAGNDALAGETGNDTYVVDAAGDVVTELANEGTDLVQSSISYTLGANVENLTLTGATAINGTGNALDNVITGNAANNTLTGGAGNDTLIGGAGIDTLIGGTGNDTYVIDVAGDVVTELANEGTDLVQSALTYTLGANVENLTLTGTAAINGTGNALDNVITGNSASNTLTGGAGNDTLNGGAGTDTLIGGAGNDVYVVDVAGDVVSELANEGTDLVQSALTYTLGANVENLTLTGIAAIDGTGNALDNAITGNAASNTLTGGAGNDSLNGAAGIDTMFGGAGNDTYYVDNVGDTVTELANEGTDIVYAYVSHALAANVENIRLHTTGNIDATGNALNNILYTGDGNNVLDGGDGIDTVSYLYAASGVTVSLASTAAQATGGSGTDTILNVENLVGGNFNDKLTGNAGANTLNGGAGADTMVGGAGNDSYNVDNAGDIVTELANEGTDTVYSTISYTLGANLENLYINTTGAVNATGNALANVLYAGAGNNVIDGLDGSDTVSYAYAASGVTVSLANAAAQVTGGSGTDTLLNIENLVGGSYNDILIGNAGVNGLTGGAGNDTLNGGAGADTLAGGVGNDTYVLGRGYGIDTITENDATAGNTDVAQFAADIAIDQLWFQKVGNNLEVSVIGSTDKFTLSNWYLGDQYQVEQFKAGGKTLLDSQVQNLVQAMAGFAPPAAGQTTLPANYQSSLAPVLAANWT